MGRVAKSAACGVIALTMAAIANPVAADIVPTNPFAQRLLEAHNRERAIAGTPPLQWSDKLAVEAREWAEHLAREGRMVHADRETRRAAGENLWQGQAGYYSAETMISTFTDEKQYYRHAAFPDISTTGEWRDVGHYTQVIWRETQQVGCAVAENGYDDFLVCRYWPAGNWYGKMAY